MSAKTVDPILMSVLARTFRSITDEMSASVVKTTRSGRDELEQGVQHGQRQAVRWGVSGIGVDDVQHGPQVPLAGRHRAGHPDPLLRRYTHSNRWQRDLAYAASYGGEPVRRLMLATGSTNYR